MVAMKNLMEELVYSRINEIMDTLDCCSCERCKTDIMSYALNRLPAKYASSESGALYSKLELTDTNLDTMITTVVVQGIEIVSHNPNHN